MTQAFHCDDTPNCHYFCMFIPDPVFDSVVKPLFLLADNIVIYNYNSLVLRTFRIFF